MRIPTLLLLLSTVMLVDAHAAVTDERPSNFDVEKATRYYLEDCGAKLDTDRLKTFIIEGEPAEITSLLNNFPSRLLELRIACLRQNEKSFQTINWLSKEEKQRISKALLGVTKANQMSFMKSMEDSLVDFISAPDTSFNISDGGTISWVDRVIVQPVPVTGRCGSIPQLERPRSPNEAAMLQDKYVKYSVCLLRWRDEYTSFESFTLPTFARLVAVAESVAKYRCGKRANTKCISDENWKKMWAKTDRSNLQRMQSWLPLIPEYQRTAAKFRSDYHDWETRYEDLIQKGTNPDGAWDKL